MKLGNFGLNQQSIDMGIKPYDVRNPDAIQEFIEELDKVRKVSFSKNLFFFNSVNDRSHI